MYKEDVFTHYWQSYGVNMSPLFGKGDRKRTLYQPPNLESSVETIGLYFPGNSTAMR